MSEIKALLRDTCLPNLAEVKHLVAGIEFQISTLVAYRKSLMHECVTGPCRITEIVYLTDGRARRVKLGNREIRLKSTTRRNMTTAGRISGMIIQAFRYIGKDRLTKEHVEMLRKKLSADDKRCLTKDRLHAPAVKLLKKQLKGLAAKQGRVPGRKNPG